MYTRTALRVNYNFNLKRNKQYYNIRCVLENVVSVTICSNDDEKKESLRIVRSSNRDHVRYVGHDKSVHGIITLCTPIHQLSYVYLHNNLCT